MVKINHYLAKRFTFSQIVLFEMLSEPIPKYSHLICTGGIPTNETLRDDDDEPTLAWDESKPYFTLENLVDMRPTIRVIGTNISPGDQQISRLTGSLLILNLISIYKKINC
jgi:hypothetical protein